MYNRRNSLDPYITWTAAVMLQKFVLPPILQTIMHHEFRAQKKKPCFMSQRCVVFCQLRPWVELGAAFQACQILQTARSCNLQAGPARCERCHAVALMQTQGLVDHGFRASNS